MGGFSTKITRNHQELIDERRGRSRGLWHDAPRMELERPDATTPVRPALEPEALAFAEATANPPYLFDLDPVEGRKAVDEVQPGDVELPVIDEEWITVTGGPTGSVRARIVRPAGSPARCR